MSGKVTLVGGGIGSLGNITLNGLNALKNAEVVVYDKLLGEGIEELIPESAEKINAGKQSSNHLIPQDEINNILISKAKEGKKVVRLKGGDGYLFGRGGEEAQALHKAGVDFSVIPGVTSAIAAPAYAGIPVTHRDFASSVHIITGHSKESSELAINFDALVKAGGTLVFLMGVKNLGLITEGLLKAGMPATTACAVIERGGTAYQRKVVASLGDITYRADGLRSPAVIVVGAVCSLSNELDWFSNLPLNGKSIVIAREREKAAKLAQALRELGAEVTVYPCIRIVPVSIDINEILSLKDKYKWIAFTSSEGVKRFFNALYEKGFDARVLAGKKLAAVGKKTAVALKEFGIIADLVPQSFYGHCLGKKLKDNNAENVLILRAENGAEGITNALKEAGINYVDKAIYKTVGYTEHNVKLPDKIDYAVFYSPSQVQHFDYKGNYKAVCFGSTTAAAAKNIGISCITASEQTDESVIAAILMDSEN